MGPSVSRLTRIAPALPPGHAVARRAVLVGLLALAVRTAFVLDFASQPLFDINLVPGTDMEFLVGWARRIAGGDLLSRSIGTFWWAPLFPYVLAAVFAVVGSTNLLTAALAQAALGALTATLVYLLGRKLFDDETGLLAGILAGLYGPAIFYTGVFLSTTLEVFLSVLILYLVTRGRERPTGLRWLGAGVAAGLGCLARPNFLLGVLALVALLPILGPLGGRRFDRKTCWRAALAFCMGIMVIVRPNIARNRIVGGQWVVVSAAGPETFRIANSYDSTPMNFVYPKRPPMPLTSYEFWRHQARKAALFWWGFEAPQNVNYYLARDASWVLGLPWLAFWLAVPLAAFGLWTARHKAPALAHVYVFLGAYYLSVVAFFVIARWRLPLVVPLLIFTAAGLISLYRRAIAGDYTYVGASAVAITLLATLVHPGRGPFVFAADHGQLGYILVNRGRYEEAAEPLARAAAAFPGNGALQRDLGRVFLRLGRTGEARAALERGAALLPEDPVVHRILGRLLADAHADTARARAHLERALTLAPDAAEAAEVRALLRALDRGGEAP